MGALVVLAAQAGSIEPGSEAEIVVLVRNTGEEADTFPVVVQGQASGWAVVDPPVLSLAPGEEAPAWVHFRPPRSFSTTPGPTPFAIAVASTSDPDFLAVETGELDIGTFSSITAAMSSTPTVGARWAVLGLSIRNTGNRRVTLSVAAETAAQGVVVEVEPEELSLAPGQPMEALIRVRPPRRLLLPGRKIDRRLTLSVVSDGGALATVRTEYPEDPSLVNELIRSARVLAVLLVLLFFGGIALLRSETTSGSVDVTQGGGFPVDLPPATSAPEEPPTSSVDPPPTTPTPTPTPTPTDAAGLPEPGPAPVLPRLVFVRVYGPGSRDLVIRQPGDRESELRLRSDNAVELRPRLSPDGTHVAFIREKDGAWRVSVIPVAGGEAVAVADTTSDAAVAWSPDGATLFFSRSGTLQSVPYDATTKTAGPEVDRGVAVPGGNFALARDGSRIVVADGRKLLLRPVDGSPGITVDVSRSVVDPSFSPDGSRVVFTADFQIFTVGAGGGAVRQLTRPGSVNGEATWTAAGDWVVFRSNRSGLGDLYTVKASAANGDETGLAQLTTSNQRDAFPSF